jgi:hypothetical protein
MERGAPAWAFPLLLFGTFGAIWLVVAAIYLLPAVRYVRAEMRRSPEDRATGGPSPPADDLPTVPDVGTDPGRVLPVALRRDGLRPGASFGLVLGFALFWNGGTAVFVGFAVAEFRAGRGNWFLPCFLFPFVLIGLVVALLALYAGYGWVVSVLVGRVGAEVSGHPLVPGGRYELAVTQHGLVRLTEVEVELVCEEVATYPGDESATTERHTAVSHPVTDRGPAYLPLAAGFTVPAGAMHSFESANNQIKWTVRVTGRASGRPFGVPFLVCVRPGEA